LFQRKGKERKGKERKGKERKGKERKGKERKGKERKGWVFSYSYVITRGSADICDTTYAGQVKKVNRLNSIMQRQD